MVGQERPVIPILVLVGALIAVSSSAVLVQWTETPAVTLAFWRTLGGAVALAPGAISSTNKPNRHHWLLLAIAGVALGVHFATWLASLRLTSVAASVSLVSTAPIFVALLGLAAGRKLSRYTVPVLGLAVVGTTIIAHSESSSGQFPTSMRGNGLALIGAATIAVYFVVGERLRERLSTSAYACRTYAVAAFGLLFYAIASGTELRPRSLTAWLVILGMILGPQLAGHTALNYLLARLGPLTISLALLAEPIGASLLVWLIFEEVPPTATWLGSALVVSAVALHLVTRSTIREERQPIDAA